MMQPQVKYEIDLMEEYLENDYMKEVYRDLHPTAEQRDDDDWWNNVYIKTAVDSDTYDFQEKWAEQRDASQYEALVMIEMINQIFKWNEDENGISEKWWVDALTISKIYKMFAYMYVVRCGVEHWKDQSVAWTEYIAEMGDNDAEEEYTGTKDFPPNETDDICPICLEAYTWRKQKDGIRNSEYKVKCPHYCCCDCWLELYEKNEGEKKRCPICRANVTDWLESVIPSYYPDYP
jgi:hypothetical protein